MKQKTTMLILLIFSSCSLDSTEYQIQDELMIHVERFYQEAEIRGYSLPKNNLKMTLEKGLRERCKCLGVTSWEKGGWDADPQVTTKIDFDYFYSSDSSKVSFTVFHELGHGILRREAHSNTVSIMNPAISNYKITPLILNELYQNNEL